MASTTAEEKYELITRRLQEVLGGESLKAILAEGRTPRCYWGVYFLFSCIVIVQQKIRERSNWTSYVRFPNPIREYLKVFL